MGPRAGMEGVRSPDRPARSESLYRLSYRGPLYMMSYHTKLGLSPKITSWCTRSGFQSSLAVTASKGELKFLINL